MKEMWVQSLGEEDPWRRKWQPTPVFLPGKPHGQRSLAGYSSWVAKKPDTTQRLNKTATTKNLTISSSYIPKISFSNCKCNLINN